MKLLKSLFLKYLSAIFFVSFISLFVYYFTRVSFFLLASGSFYSFIFSLLLLLAESFVVLHALGFIINIFDIETKKRPITFKKISRGKWPSVAVVLPVKNEPEDVLENTISFLKALDYENKNIYLIDDSSHPIFIAKNIRLIKKHDIKYFRPKNLKTAKAGAINEFIEVMPEKYLAVFDADQNPVPSFLKETVSIIEADEKIAFVQTPQFYSNIHKSTIARGASMQQSIFFETICEAKDSVRAMFCCGTNFLMRKDVLKEVGGFVESSITEDFATSVKIHMLGYQSVYFNHTRVFGMAPETLQAYLGQQARWAGGTVKVLVFLTKNLFKNPKSLSLSQWWEYFLSSSYYFMGWAFFLLMLCPIAFLIFNTPAYFIDNSRMYLFVFIPYYLFNSAIFYGTMKNRNYRFWDIYHGGMLSLLIFPVLIIATFKSLLLGKTLKFEVTPKGVSGRMPFMSLWPWTVTLVINVIAILFGLIKLPTMPFAALANIFWCLYHVFLISHIYYFNSET